MSELCPNGPFVCAFEATLGAGTAFVIIILLLATIGFFDE
jgi:hypothetical protein